MPGFKHPCRYCGKLVPPDSNVCPMCGRRSPDIARCPKCKSPIKKDYMACSYCGLSLKITCPRCGKTTFFDEYCEHCGLSLTITCPNPKCRTEQPPVDDKCIKCGKPLK